MGYKFLPRCVAGVLVFHVLLGNSLAGEEETGSRPALS